MDTKPIQVSTGGQSGVKEIDWLNRSDRKWLDSHLHWAMMNDHAIVLLPVTGKAPNIV